MKTDSVDIIPGQLMTAGEAFEAAMKSAERVRMYEKKRHRLLKEYSTWEEYERRLNAFAMRYKAQVFGTE